MGFIEYGKTSANSKALAPTDVKIAVSGKKNFNLCIVIGFELLKECGLIIGDKVGLYFGTDEDKGKLLIKKMDSGVSISSYSHRKSNDGDSHGQIIRKVQPVPPIEDFTNKNIPSEKVEHAWDVDAAGLIVKLPKSFFQE